MCLESCKALQDAGFGLVLSNWYSDAESRPASLKVLFFFFFNAVSCFVTELSSAMVSLFDVQQLVVVSASRTIFENQAEENAGGKWIKHPLFPVGNMRAATCAVSPVIERAAATRHI